MKKLFSILVCMAMLLALIPCVSVFAAEIVDSGTHGDKLTWTLDSEGVLTISGEGNMADYDYTLFFGAQSDSPFYGNDNIKTVIIENGITSIGDGAFLRCKSLASVSIPDSVTAIGGAAFAQCESFRYISIPDGVASIGPDAFSDTAYYYDETNWTDGVLYIGNHLIEADKNTVMGEYTVRTGTKTIANGAFYDCRALTNINIPDSVTSIGGGAFDDCNSLTSISIPNSVSSIGNRAFVYCTGLTSVNIPNSVTSIGDDVFSHCESLASVSIGSGVTSIPYKAFAYCKSLASISIPDSVTSIGILAFSGTAYYNDRANWTDGVLYIGNHLIEADKNTVMGEYTVRTGTKTIANLAFENCIKLTSVSIPDSVTAIGNMAFSDCTGIADVYYSGSEEAWKAISIGYVNEPLTEATIHYNCIAEAKPEIVDITATVGGGTVKLTVATENVAVADAVFSVGYDADGGVTAAAEVIDGSATLPSETKTVKVFVWESLESMKPLCKAVEKTI